MLHTVSTAKRAFCISQRMGDKAGTTYCGNQMWIRLISWHTFLNISNQVFFFLVVLGFWSLTSIINSNALWWNYPNTMESNVCPVCSLFWFCVPLNSECWYQILLHWTKITFTLIPALSILCNVRPVEQRRVNSCVYFSQDKLKQNHKATK